MISNEIFFSRISDDSIFNVKIHLIDYGSIEFVSSQSLKMLPDSYKDLDALVVDLRITNIVPFDNDYDSWDSEMTSALQKTINDLKTKISYSVCNVQFSIRNMIFAKTFEIKRVSTELKNKITVFDLENYLIRNRFCLKNDNLEDNIKQLLDRAGIHTSNITLSQPLVKTEAATKSETLSSITASTIRAVPRLKQLNVGSEYKVLLKQFDNPGSFYVVIDETNNQTLKIALTKIKNFNQLQAKSAAKEGDVCLVAGKNENRRGLVTKVDDKETVDVFLVDYGISVKISKDDIFDLPSDIVDLLPFQAIKCSLFGLKPKFGLQEWPKKLSSVFKDFIEEICGERTISMRVVSCKENCYSVLLFHPTTSERIDLIAIQEELALPSDDCSEVMIPMAKSERFESIEKTQILEMIENMDNFEAQKMIESYYLNRES